MSFREVRGESRENRPADYGWRHALARRQRRKYPSNTIDATAAEFRLSTGAAKGAVYGEASRATLDQCLKMGGWALVIELGAEVLGQPLENYIKEQAAKARQERIEWEKRERDHQARLVALADVSRLDRTAS